MNEYLDKYKIPTDYALHHTIPGNMIDVMLGNALLTNQAKTLKLIRENR